MPSGAKLETIEDLRVRLPGSDFVITREYISQHIAGAVWLLGEGWSLSVFNSIRTDMNGPGGTERIVLRGLPLEGTNVFELVTASNPATWRASPRGQEHIQQAQLTTNFFNYTTNAYVDTTRSVWRLTYPGVSHVDFYRSDTISTPPELVGLIAQEGDVFGNIRTYDYQTFESPSGVRSARLMRIRCYATSTTSGTPLAEVYFSWCVHPEDVDVNSRVRFGRLSSMSAVRYHPGEDGDYGHATNIVDYRYFQPSDVMDGEEVAIHAHDPAVGTAGDLVEVRYIDEVEANSAFSTVTDRVRISQYRYFGGATVSLNGETLSGIAHQLKAVFGPEQIEYAAQYVAPGTLDIHWLDKFADDLLLRSDTFAIQGFEANRPVLDIASKVLSYYGTGSNIGRVKTQFLQNGCGCSGASQSTRQGYSYWFYGYASGATDGRSAKMAVSYHSGASYVPLRNEYYDFKDLSPTSGPYLINHAVMSTIDGLGQRWVTHYDYDMSSTFVAGGTHNLIDVVLPSAVSQYTAVDEAGGLTNGVRPSTSFVAQGSQGLVRHFAFDQFHQVIDIGESRGISSSTIPVKHVTYWGGPQGNTRYWLPASVDVYTDSGSTDAATIQTTTMSYGFRSGDALAFVGWTLEAESNAEGGPGGNVPATCLFDERGQLRWIRAFDGALTYRSFDSTTGEQVRLVRNANPSGESSYPALSSSYYGNVTIDSSWGRFADGGSLTWTSTVDNQGRRLSTTDPAGASTFLHRQMRTDDQHTGSPFLYYSLVGLPPRLPESGSTAAHASEPATMVWLDAAGEALRASDFLLAADGSYDPANGSYTITSSEASRALMYRNLGGIMTSERWWHDVPNNGSYLTTYEYDDAGRLAYVTDPSGTILRIPGNEHDPVSGNPINGYDALGRVLIEEIGTSRDPANFTRAAEYFYDDTNGDSTLEQGTGDGNLTFVRMYTGEGSSGLSSNSRTVARTYNFRDELIRIVGPTAPYAELDYDNIGRIKRVGLFNSPPSGDEPTSLRAQTSATRGVYVETSYSQRGLPYRTAVAVNPADLTAGFLERRGWFDADGRPVESWSPGHAAIKKVYDGLGRAKSLFATDRGGDDLTGASAYGQATSRSGDTVFEQVNRTFDGLGRLSLIAHLRRLHDTAATGDLQVSASPPNAVTTYTGLAYDPANRLIGQVEYGTNDASKDILKSGGSAPSALTQVPSRSDSNFTHTLIRSAEYNDRGLIEKAIDPIGHVSKYYYDDLERTFAVVENFASDPTFSFSNGRWHASGSLTGDQNRATSFVYDGLDNVTVETAHLPWENSTEKVEVTKYIYSYHDAYGSDTVGSPSASTATLAANNSLLYQIWYPDRSTTGSTSGEASSDNKTTYSYNALGEVRSFTGQNFPSQNGTRHVYSRDDFGRPIQDKVDQFGPNIDQYVGAIQATYDLFGRLDRVSSLSTGANPTYRNQVRFRYSPLRQISRLYQDNDGVVQSNGDDGTPSSNTSVVQYAYDTQALANGNYSRLTDLTYPSRADHSGAVYTTEFGDTGSPDDRASRPVMYRIDGAKALRYTYLGLNTAALVEYMGISVELDRTIKADGHRRSAAVQSGTMGEYPGFDRLGRLLRQTWVDSDIDNGGGTFPTRPQILAEVYSYDRNSNRTSRTDGRPGASLPTRDFKFDYDGLDRLKEAMRGANNKDQSGNLVWTPGRGSQRWTLDVLGSWNDLEQDLAPNGSGNYGGYGDATGDLHETRTHNRDNELTGRVPNAGQSNLPFTYDATGNLRSYTRDLGGTRTVTHDAWNRIVKVEEQGEVPPNMQWYSYLSGHTYNGLHWRISTTNNNFLTKREMFYSAAWRLLEERVVRSEEGNDTPLRRIEHFWGNRYIDDPVSSRVFPYVLQGGNYVEDTPRAYYHVTDAQFSTVAMLDDTGRLVERVTYDAHGGARHRWPGDFNGDGYYDPTDYNALMAMPTVSISSSNYVPDMDLDRDGVVKGATDVGFAGNMASPLADGSISSPDGPDSVIGFGGYLFDQPTGWNAARFRWYMPQMGRWVQRDPLGKLAGLNDYLYVDGSPIGHLDPFGLFGQPDGSKANGPPKQPGEDIGDLRGKLRRGNDDGENQLGMRLTPAEQKNADEFNRKADEATATYVKVIEAGTNLVVSVIPGVGEAQDIGTLADPNVRWYWKAAAGGSLVLSVVTLGTSPNAGGFIRGATRVEEAYHATSAVGVKSILKDGINIVEWAEADARFGKAFYIAEDARIAVKEKPTGDTMIRFTVDLTGKKVLDFTDPKIAKAWGYAGGERDAYRALGEKARKGGYDAIRFPSEKGKGNNLAILNNTDPNAYIKPQMVSPIPCKRD